MNARDMLANVPEALRPLLPELLEVLESSLGAARGALVMGDREAAAREAHALKGACMRFGLDGLAAHAARAEEALVAGEAGAARALDDFGAALAELGPATR